MAKQCRNFRSHCSRFDWHCALSRSPWGLSRPGTVGNWVGWIGVVPILTALFGTCPAYSLFGLSTR